MCIQPWLPLCCVDCVSYSSRSWIFLKTVLTAACTNWRASGPLGRSLQAKYCFFLRIHNIYSPLLPTWKYDFSKGFLHPKYWLDTTPISSPSFPWEPFTVDPELLTLSLSSYLHLEVAGNCIFVQSAVRIRITPHTRLRFKEPEAAQKANSGFMNSIKPAKSSHALFSFISLQFSQQA